MSVRLTRDLNAEGMDSGSIRRMVRDQQLHRIRRGAFVTQLDQGAHRHLQLIRATVPRLGPDNVLSHISAAVLHGLPVDGRGLERVTVTRPGRGGAKFSPYLHRYRTPLPEQDVEFVGGFRRTVLARTVFDLGRCLDLGFSVAAADAALRRGLTRAALAEQLAAAPRRCGVARARVMIELADARSESAGESLSRVTLWRLGMPTPELQVEVAASGRDYRGDFGWPEFRVIGEFDGKTKYGELLRPGETAADVVMREKRREADLRAAGWRVVRWTYADVLNPERLDGLVRPELLAGGWRP